MIHTAWVGLGSNLEDPCRQVSDALIHLASLPLTTLCQHSSLYSGRPVGPQDQPDFVNAVARLQTALSPLALLDQLQALEQRHRRIRQRHWGPRTLDLDLLLFDDLTLDLPRLVLPHSHLHERAFVLLPMLEISPELALPDGRRIDRLAAAASSNDLKRLSV